MTPPMWFSETGAHNTGQAADLFCLPYAGGGASVFRRWPASFIPDIRVLPVQLPGRETRIAEPPEFDAAEVAAAIADRVDRPFALFGHSLGGRLAFEVVREFRRNGAPLPAAVYVSGSKPPDVRADGPFDKLSRLDDAELLERVVQGGGVPAEVLAEPELLDLILPTLRADFAWLDDYVYRAESPLPVRLTAFAGHADTAVTPAAMAGWARHTTAGFALHPLAGGHFFLHDRIPEIASVIRSDLRTLTHAGGRR
ncbi:thioesterase II family protein [Catenulispora rubra]|uniref:thioesterase II family protein n=1 Tax=Catenulispora rubra TaxID=280293 RepID=UPI002B27848C|nr:alpha/beta fold hydrolase [Catenulispora rubra]